MCPFCLLVSQDEFEDIIKKTTLYHKIPFDFKSEFMALHFGGDRKRTVSYAEFSQLLHVSDLHVLFHLKEWNVGLVGTIAYSKKMHKKATDEEQELFFVHCLFALFHSRLFH